MKPQTFPPVKRRVDVIIQSYGKNGSGHLLTLWLSVDVLGLFMVQVGCKENNKLASLKKTHTGG